MPITLPVDLKKNLVDFIKKDEIRGVYLAHILKSQINENAFSDHTLHQVAADEPRRVNLDRAVRIGGKIRGQEVNPLFQTDNFEKILSDYEQAEMSLVFQQFIEVQVGNKIGMHLFETLNDLGEAVDALIPAKQELSVEPVVATNSTALVRSESQVKGKTIDLIAKILETAPFLFASFKLHQKLEAFTAEETKLRAKLVNANIVEAEQIKKKLAVLAKKESLCNKGLFVDFLNRYPSYNIVYYQFYTACQQAFANEVLVKEFVEAVIGVNGQANGLMQGEIKPLMNFLHAHQTIADFMQNKLDVLMPASKDLVAMSNGAYDYSHIDLIIGGDIRRLYADIKKTINEITEAVEKNLSRKESSSNFFSKSLIFSEVNKAVCLIRENYKKTIVALDEKNRLPNNSLSHEALKALRHVLSSANSNLDTAFNNSVSKSANERDVYNQLNNAISELYSKTTDLADRTTVFERIYKTDSSLELRY